jgi:hypothetical protein
VAGYTELYRELNLLPDIAIAEEARDNGSQEIFNDIMSQPTKFAVMNDYKRTVDTENPRSPAFINGDTTVSSHLARRLSLDRISWRKQLISDGDITEDSFLAETTAEDVLFYMKIPPTAPDHTLLHLPLPPDLPAFYFSKDLLSLTAAYEGNIDRYVRLKRPVFVPGEIMCVTRGIYHNTLYARWWQDEIESAAERYQSWEIMRYIKAAIAARYLMEGNPNYLLAQPLDFLPFQIWHPKQASEPTLQLVLRERPQMRYSVAHTCIAAGYKALWDGELGDVVPTYELERHANRRGGADSYFRDDLKRRRAVLDPLREADPPAWEAALRYAASDRDFVIGYEPEFSSTEVENGLNVRSVRTEWDGGPYEGLWAGVHDVELYVCAPYWLKNYIFQKDAGPMDVHYWTTEKAMHEELARDGDEELSRRIGSMIVSGCVRTEVM